MKATGPSMSEADLITDTLPVSAHTSFSGYTMTSVRRARSVVGVLEQTTTAGARRRRTWTGISVCISA